jgi:protein involved in polysaccharide export with SLBB domain
MLQVWRTAWINGAVLGSIAFSIAVSNVPANAQTSTAGQAACTDSSGFSSYCQGSTVESPTPQSGARLQSQPSTQTNLTDSEDSQRGRDSQQLYIDQAGSQTRRQTNSSVDRAETLFPPDPITDFQRLAHSSTGEVLSVFGRDMFRQAPSTFAPANQIPVTADYVVGPGDEILVRLWGPESFNSQLTGDNAGSIYIPKVGAIHVAGMRSDQLQDQISAEVDHTYRNYRISVSLGQLRSIQVYVVGEARRPGAYTISALSTVLNALFVSGGPNVQGSMRRIQVRHENMPPTEFDLYDLVLRGDKSKDIRLRQGDTIFIPAAGPQVALAGSVRHPAIYELRGETTAADLLELAGGYTSTAKRNLISLERVDEDLTRKAMMVNLDAAGKGMTLRDGDVLFVNHITQGYEQSVTIRGNLANPGRFAWHPGMKLSEIIPDTKSLLTSDYWRERNRLGVPSPLFDPQQNNLQRPLVPVQRARMDGPNANSSGYGNNTRAANASGLAQDDQTITGNTSNLAMQSAQSVAPIDSAAATLFSPGNQGTTNTGNVGSSLNNGSSTSTAMESNTAEMGVADQRFERNDVNPNERPKNKVEIPAPEIDWSYAVIERLDPKTLKTSLLPFNLGQLVQAHNTNEDAELQAGDVVTIFSQADIPVPMDERTKFVRLEGEFVAAGVYSVLPGEDLESLVRRAGGLTDKAYLYGSSFLRESTRVFQQRRLNEYISSLSTDMERSAAVRAASSSSGLLDPNMLNEERTMVAQLRQMRATGRIVLEFRPDSAGTNSIPKISLENGDVFRIPSRPSTVSVVGAVYGQNVFLYDAKHHLGDYVTLAGKPNRIADPKHAFIIRADGSVFSRVRTQGVLSNNFESSPIYPGDAVVIPEKLIKPTALRNILDYSQILSSFGLAAAAISVVR